MTMQKQESTLYFKQCLLCLQEHRLVWNERKNKANTELRLSLQKQTHNLSVWACTHIHIFTRIFTLYITQHTHKTSGAAWQSTAINPVSDVPLWSPCSSPERSGTSSVPKRRVTDPSWSLKGSFQPSLSGKIRRWRAPWVYIYSASQKPGELAQQAHQNYCTTQVCFLSN